MSNKTAKNLTLSIETATRSGSLAVLDGVDVRQVWQGTEQFSHSGEMLIEIKNLLEKAACSLKSIKSIAVAVGPGSFTGLRVGLATAKGLATALNVSVAGVPTLAALSLSAAAHDNTHESQEICSVIAAGRNNVFAQIYQIQNKVVPFSDLTGGTLANIFEQPNFAKTRQIVAPSELHDEILSVIGESSENVELSQPPDNLATFVGRIAAANSLESNGDELKLIYGRDADVSKSKK